MRTTVDLPDPLLKHLKARAALEGRTLSDLVVGLVQRGLEAAPRVDAPQRLQARPLVGSAPLAVPTERLSHADLSALAQEDEDERARAALAAR